MRRLHVREYLARDWSLVAQSKRAFWLERKRRLGPAADLELAGELWRQAKTLHPDWPTDAEREADRRNHLRVSEILRRVPRPKR